MAARQREVPAFATLEAEVLWRVGLRPQTKGELQAALGKMRGSLLLGALVRLSGAGLISLPAEGTRGRPLRLTQRGERVYAALSEVCAALDKILTRD